MARAAMATTARPPTTPPTIGPTFDELFPDAAGAVEVVAAELEVVVDETDVVRPGVMDADVDTAEIRSVRTAMNMLGTHVNRLELERRSMHRVVSGR